MRELQTYQRVDRVLRAALGDEYDHGGLVTDVLINYAEPGYSSQNHNNDGDDAVIVLGDWNPSRWPRDGEPELTKAESFGPRLARALERAGADLEWLDEWTQCDECYRAMRTTADSYSWTMYGAWVECGYVCADCLRDDIAGYIDAGGYIDNPNMAITWLSGAELERAGWTQWEPHDPHYYESGWYPGQDDDPTKVLAQIRRETSADVVFLINSVGQFDCRWSAYTRDEIDD